MRRCLTPPCSSSGCATPHYFNSCCSMFDFDADGDVDINDVGAMQRRYDDPDESR